MTICKACAALRDAAEQKPTDAAHLTPDAPVGANVGQYTHGRGLTGPQSQVAHFRCAEALCDARWLKAEGPDGPQWEIRR